MLWERVKIDIVGAPRCECDECSCLSETDEFEISEGPYRGTVESSVGPYRGTVEAPVRVGSYSLAREMYKIAVVAKDAKSEARKAEEAAKVAHTKAVVLPAVLAVILERAKAGVTYAPLRSLMVGHQTSDYYTLTLEEGLEEAGFDVVQVGAGGSDMIKWHFPEEDKNEDEN